MATDDTLSLFREPQFAPAPEPTTAPEPPAPHVDQRTNQASLFGNLDDFTRAREEWQGMPEFAQENLRPWKQLIVSFENRADMDAFAALVGQRLTEKTQSIWYPEAEIGRMVTKRYKDEP